LPAPPSACVGDCNGSGDVTFSELIRMVDIAFGNTQLLSCEAADANHDGQVTIDEVNVIALTGSPLYAIPSPRPWLLPLHRRFADRLFSR